MRTSKRVVPFLILVLFCTAAVFAGGRQEADTQPETSAAEEQAAAEQSVANDQSVEVGAPAPDWLVKETDDYITVIDNGGHEVTIEKPVKRIVIIGMAVFPTVKAIMGDNLVVGMSFPGNPLEAQLFYPEMAKRPDLGSDAPGALDYERLVSLEPDAVVVLSVSRNDVNENLAGTGIPVVQLDFTEEKDIAILGAILDRDREAREYIEWIDAITRPIAERVGSLPDHERPSVFLYYGGHYGMAPPPPYGTYGTENLLGHRTIRMAGGKTVSEEVPGEWITVDPEWVIEKNPDVILREYYNVQGFEQPPVGYDAKGTSEAQGLLDSILAAPAFEVSDAVKAGKVYIFDGLLISRFWFIGLQYFAQWFHPGLFSDLDPAAVHQEYLTRFMRIDYDVRNQGVFVYP
jgi:iron complex transport system substrate-binding protein